MFERSKVKEKFVVNIWKRTKAITRKFTIDGSLGKNAFNNLKYHWTLYRNWWLELIE